jgi:hypothetical protein
MSPGRIVPLWQIKPHRGHLSFACMALTRVLFRSWVTYRRCDRRRRENPCRTGPKMDEKWTALVT